MTKRGILSLSVLALGVSASVAIVPARADDETPPVKDGHTWVQHLAEQARARHPGVRAITVESRPEAGKPSILLASTLDRLQVLSPVANPAPDHGSDAVAGGLVVHRPYLSSTHHQIGTLTVTLAKRKGQSNAALEAEAGRIAAEMALVTLSAKNAADPYPFDPAWGPNKYAQALTMRTIAKHPDLLVMMIHATPPGHDKNLIIGSNIGRFGKIADEDDTRVIDKGSTNLEIGGDNDRFETELPLLDATGKRIGALGLVFNYHDGQSKEALHSHGLAIRDEVARQIPNNAALFRPIR